MALVTAPANGLVCRNKDAFARLVRRSARDRAGATWGVGIGSVRFPPHRRLHCTSSNPDRCTGNHVEIGTVQPVSQKKRVFVAGHRGLVGSVLLRRLQHEHVEVLTATREQLDLRNQSEVSNWFKAHRPEQVYLVAGTVGGILANSTRPGEFIYDNLMIHSITNRNVSNDAVASLSVSRVRGCVRLRQSLRSRRSSAGRALRAPQDRPRSCRLVT